MRIELKRAEPSASAVRDGESPNPTFEYSEITFVLFSIYHTVLYWGPR